MRYVVEGAGVGALWEVATHMHKLSCPGLVPRPQPISSLISTVCQHFRVSLSLSSCFSLSCFFFFSVFSSGVSVFSASLELRSLVIAAARAFSLGGSVLGEE